MSAAAKPTAPGRLYPWVDDLHAQYPHLVPRVVNLKREPYDRYIGRAGHGQDGSLGNPFRIGEDGDRQAVLVKFDAYTWQNERIISLLPELHGQRLGCFCRPQGCHGDTYAALVCEHAGLAVRCVACHLLSPAGSMLCPHCGTPAGQRAV